MFEKTKRIKLFLPALRSDREQHILGQANVAVAVAFSASPHPAVSGQLRDCRRFGQNLVMFFPRIAIPASDAT
jgi:hypothetical protein